MHVNSARACKAVGICDHDRIMTPTLSCDPSSEMLSRRRVLRLGAVTALGIGALGCQTTEPPSSRAGVFNEIWNDQARAFERARGIPALSVSVTLALPSDTRFAISDNKRRLIVPVDLAQACSSSALRAAAIVYGFNWVCPAGWLCIVPPADLLAPELARMGYDPRQLLVLQDLRPEIAFSETDQARYRSAVRGLGYRV